MEPMAAEEEVDNRHRDFQGESVLCLYWHDLNILVTGDISEQFLPMMGENTETMVSTPGQSPVRREAQEASGAVTGAGSMMINDSDDSL